MASILNPNEKENEEIGSMQFGQQADSAPSQGGNPQPPSPPQGSPAPRGSGRFMNLQKYVNANLPQASQMAGRIGGNFAQKAGATQQGVQNIQNQFSNRVADENTRLNQTGQYVNQLGTAQGAQGILNSPEELQKFQQIQQGQLGLNAADLSSQQQQMQALQEQGKLAGSEAGRFQLLRQNFGTPSYNLGQRKLDQLLLQTAPGATRAMQEQINPALQNLQQTLTGAEQDISSKYTGLQGLAGEQQQAIGSALSSGVTGIEGDLEKAREDALAGRTEAMRQFGVGVDNRNLSKEQMMTLSPSLSGNPYSSLYGLNLQDYMKPQDQLSDISVGQVASPEQAQRYASLQQLGSLTGKYSGLAADQNGYDKMPFDNERLTQEIANREGSFQQAFRPQVDQYKAFGESVNKLENNAGLTKAIDAYIREQADPATPGYKKPNYVGSSAIYNQLVNAGISPEIARSVIKDTKVNPIIERGNANQIESAIDPEYQKQLIRNLSANSLSQRQALQSFAEKEGALSMMADYAPQESFGKGDQPIFREDRDQFQQLLDNYLGNKVRMQNDPYAGHTTGLGKG